MSPRPLFDRRVPSELIDLLKPGGDLGGLAERAAHDRREALDLHLRGNPKKRNEGSVTLYVGLTKAFDLYGRGDGSVRVSPQPKHGPGDEARERGWTRWMPRGQLVGAEFLGWVDAMIAAAFVESSSKTDNEGAVQAHVSRGVDGWFRAIDRETMFAFESRAIESHELERIREPLQPVVRRVRDSGKPWAQKGGSPARKLDVLGVDQRGRVLVIEVKPGHQTGMLAWTPYQVAQYMAQARAWVDGEPRAAEILNGMLAQRERLGLLKPGRWAVSSKVDLVPVIAVGLPVRSKEIDERLQYVYRAVHELTPSFIDGLEIWGVEPEERGGEIGRIELGQLRGARIGNGATG